MVGDTNNRVSFEITSSSTSPLAINFVYDQNSWLKVEFYASDGGEVQLLESGIDYVYGGSGPAGTGTVTLQSGFLSTITTGTLVAYRDTPPLQETDFTYNDRLPSTLLERSLDRLTRSVQDAILTGQTFRFPQSDPSSYAASYTFSGANERAGTLLGFSDSTTTPGLPVALTYEQAAAKILSFVDLGDVGSQVLAAISAIAPVRVYTDPTAATGNKLMSQIAMRPFAFSAVTYDEPGPFTERTVPQDGEQDGYPYYFYEDENVVISIRHRETPAGWVAERAYSGGGGALVESSDDDAATPGEASWAGSGLTIENAGTDIPGKAWINTQQDGLDPIWDELITRNSFLDLPTTNPNVAGQFFRTSTTILNVSQG